MSNNTFSLPRFISLFKKQTTEHIKTYLLCTAVLFGAILFMLIFAALVDNNKINSPVQIGIFSWELLISGSIFTSLTFTSLGNKRQSIATLTLPASHLEKFLLQWVYSYIIFQVVFLIVFFLADSIAISLFPSGIDSYGLVVKNKIANLTNEPRIIYSDLCFYALIHGFALFGAVFFEKLHFIKIAFAFLAGYLLLMAINQPFLGALIGRIMEHSAMPFGDASFTDYKYHSQYVQIQVGKNTVIGSTCALLVTAILFWIGAFYRLKEKQV